MNMTTKVCVNNVRQNYDEECEAGVNKQINLELKSSYFYLSIAFHFDRSDIASEGFYVYFKKLADKKHERANKFLSYQNLRGGHVMLMDVKAPPVDWECANLALVDALFREKEMAESYYNLKKLVDKHGDADLGHRLDDVIRDQVDIVKLLGGLVTQLKRCGQGLGSYQFDQTTMKSLAGES